MILSMTGFSSANMSNEAFDITLEMKGVNSRYLDLNLKLSNKYNYLEEPIRKLVKKNIARGKIEIYVGIKYNLEDDISIKLNESVAKQYIDAMKELQEMISFDGSLDMSYIANKEDVFDRNVEKIENPELEKEVLNLLEEAIRKFNNAREIEGKELEADLKSRVDEIEKLVENIDSYKDQVLKAYQEKLQTRIAQIADTSDYEDRIAIEVSILAEKSDITEELVRIKSHCKSFKETIDSDELTVGKKLDFIMQETNREINTIGSKSSSIDITDIVISVKSQIEKIREQVQNIQ